MFYDKGYFCIDCGKVIEEPFGFRNCKSCMRKVKKHTLFKVCQLCKCPKHEDCFGLCYNCRKDIDHQNQLVREHLSRLHETHK